MHNKPTDDRFRWLRRITEPLAALVIVALGLTHGFVYVEGGSMEPALCAGDLLVYRRGVTSFATGELVLFEYDGGLVVHRVASVNRDGALCTRGDANDSVDSAPVPVDDVRGDVVFVVPTGRIMSGLAARLD